jgi:hypothetical protein
MVGSAVVKIPYAVLLYCAHPPNKNKLSIFSLNIFYNGFISSESHGVPVM